MALVGTVAVVLALLWAFGGDLESDPEQEDVAAAEESGSGDDPSETDEEAGGEDDGGATEPPPEPVTAPPELRLPVGILNATAVPGLAGRAQARLQDGGWTVPAIGDYSQGVEASTVFFPPGMEESAEALRAQFPEIARVEPTIAGLAQDRLIVILGDDYADAVDDQE